MSRNLLQIMDWNHKKDNLHKLNKELVIVISVIIPHKFKSLNNNMDSSSNKYPNRLNKLRFCNLNNQKKPTWKKDFRKYYKKWMKININCTSNKLEKWPLNKNWCIWTMFWNRKKMKKKKVNQLLIKFRINRFKVLLKTLLKFKTLKIMFLLVLNYKVIKFNRYNLNKYNIHSHNNILLLKYNTLRINLFKVYLNNMFLKVKVKILNNIIKVNNNP